MANASFILYHYPKCSTCRKAIQFLTKLGITCETRHIVESPPTNEELERALRLVGSKRKLFNTSGMRYRELNLKDKLDDLSDEDAIKLLRSDGMLIKRPLLLGSDLTLAGFRETQWRERLG